MFFKKLCQKKSNPENSQRGSAFSDFKANIETRILKVTNISLIIIFLAIVIVGLIEMQNIPFRISFFLVSVLALIVRKKSIILSKFLVMVSYTASLGFVINNSKEFKEKGIPESYFLYGNAIGIVEFMVVLSIKNTFFKIVFILINFSVKVASFPDNFNVMMSIAFGAILILSITFYMYYDFLERKNFRIIYDSRDQSQKFQSLLSNDFPASVLITTLDFKSVIYSNNFFKQKFGDETPEGWITGFFKQFTIIVNSKVQELCPIKEQEISLYDFVQRVYVDANALKDEEGFTLAATLHNENEDAQNQEKICHYEIRIRKIMWGFIPAFTLVFNDISDKQRVMALKYADEQKDKVIATVSHELRTPINGILGLIEMVKARIKDDEVSKAFLDNCKSCSNLLLYLVNSILDLSLLRNNSLNLVKTHFNLDQLLEEMRTLYLFQSQAKKIDFLVVNEVKDHLQSSSPIMIYTDRHRLIEILINLLGNAFKFTFKGSITLKVSADENDSKKVVFSVIDTGIGIKDEDKPKLFKMFGKIPQANKNINSHGAGLGLTIVNELVKTLNDDKEACVKFESIYSQGTTFYFPININSPLVDPDDSNNITSLEGMQEYKSPNDIVQTKVEQATNHEGDFHFLTCNEEDSLKNKNSSESLNIIVHTGEDVKQSSNNILVVDDNPFNILAITFLLEKFGYKVFKACSGEECLELLDKSVLKNNKFDLILMDIQMPVLDGLETSKIINEKISQGTLYKVPIVVLTATKLNKKLRREYQKDGIFSCLEKPLNEDELEELLKQLNLK